MPFERWLKSQRDHAMAKYDQFRMAGNVYAMAHFRTRRKVYEEVLEEYTRDRITQPEKL